MFDISTSSAQQQLEKSLSCNLTSVLCFFMRRYIVLEVGYHGCSLKTYVQQKCHADSCKKVLRVLDEVPSCCL